ncbi:DUF3226 domain-containing protein, partial [Microcoleus asticus]|uniref:DUF3226 domain-containing protein n=1 Tax=Microcoleus asticus TaxID=2815231 RepID=UPI0030DC0A49
QWGISTVISHYDKHFSLIVTYSILSFRALPDNASPGVLDTLLCECGQIAYPAYMEKASSYLDEFSEKERKSLKWKNFDREKALVATVVSVLKPGKTNTTSIADNNWVSEQTQQQVPALANFLEFLSQLLELS